MPERTTVAIACQGGGSHTAFTAGVLQRLIPAIEANDRRLVGISGTSGGALAAVGAWYGLLENDATAPEVLESLWDDLVASDPADRWLNDWLVWTMHAEDSGAPLPRFSPAHVPFSDVGQDEIREALEGAVDFDAFGDLAGPEAPRLVVGTVNVTAGTFETFADADVTPKAVLASTAVPHLFTSVEIDGEHYWDGLFSQNPPIYDLLRLPPDDRPEELWIVQINPQRRDEVPTSLDAIADRRNELAGNLSLNQELRLVRTINEFLEAGYLPEDRFVHTEIRRLHLGMDLDHASKVDRDPDFVEELLERGRARADSFLAELE